MPDVNVIQPNESAESIVEQKGLSVDQNTIRVLGFPKILLEFDIEFKHKLFGTKNMTMSVTVDLLTGTCRKNDVYPELQTRTLLPASLLNPRFEKDTATETAHSFVRRQISSKSFVTPQVSVGREDTVFKLFWVIPASSPNTVHLIDTITNQFVAEDIELDEFT